MSFRASSVRFGYGPIVSVGVTAHEPLATAVGEGVGVACVGISAAVGDEEHPATTAAPRAPIAPRASRRLSSFTVFFKKLLPYPAPGSSIRPRIAARGSNGRATGVGTTYPRAVKGLRASDGGSLARPWSRVSP